jgi:hypothetical protein
MISYSPILMFPSDYHESEFQEVDLPEFARAHLRRYEPYILQDLCRIQVTATSAPSDEIITYLRLNGQPPASATRIQPGVDVGPVEFSWFLKPSLANAQHRYRLFPVEPDWSEWASDTKAAYFFIAAGSYQFQVMSRVSRNGVWIEGEPARYQFFLGKPLIAKPIAKASGGTTPTAPVVQDLSKLYSRSRALLFGITQYQDRRFGPLPYVQNDVQRMSTAFEQLGFQVTREVGSVTRSQLTQKIDEFVRNASREERLVIYISTHGFADPLDPAKGFVVTTDCNEDRPSTCASLDEIDGLVEPILKASTHPVRHLLVLLDTCSSGLGVISKSGRFNEFSVASKEGSHLMTAGLANQEAEQDPGLQMSTFTYFLADGLSGKADYTQDGVITLSELLVYVRYNVAARTNGAQTPMAGRLSGSGEIIFASQGK